MLADMGSPGRSEKTRALHLDGNGGDSISLWWATKNEWLGLVDVAGLEVEALYGDWDRRPFGDDSREYVFVARRPGP